MRPRGSYHCTSPRNRLKKAEEAARKGPVRVLPFAPMKAGLVVTGTEVATGRITDASPRVEKKLRGYGLTIVGKKVVSDEVGLIQGCHTGAFPDRRRHRHNDERPIRRPGRPYERRGRGDGCADHLLRRARIPGCHVPRCSSTWPLYTGSARVRLFRDEHDARYSAAQDNGRHENDRRFSALACCGRALRALRPMSFPELLFRKGGLRRSL